MQRPRKSSLGLCLGYSIIAILAIIAICTVSSLYSQQLSVLFRGLEPSCSIGLGSASITVQGWSANDDCAHMLAGDDFTSVSWPKLGATSRSEASGTIICEIDRADIHATRHIIVRDISGSNAGGVACAILQGVIAGPSQ